MDTLLVLNIPPELEEDLVDYLLGLDFVEGFTSYGVLGHGSKSDLSLAEQVSGRRRRLQVEILLERELVSRIIGGLQQQVGRDILWWEQALVSAGYIA